MASVLLNPATLLKKAIPVRTYTPWYEDKPGHLEIHLVAYCGETVDGKFVNTLTCVDMSTDWTECLSVLPSNKQTDFEAIQTMRTRLPFDLLGMGSDNGTEFTLALDKSAGVNEVRFRYCQYQTFTFTHLHLYKKNDQAVVE